MRFTGAAGKLPEHEQAIIFEQAASVGVPATFLAAIRLAENGRAGREFGVLSEGAETYEKQARIAALSIRNNQYRYVLKTDQWPIDSATGQLNRSFVEFMAARWAPTGAANDPDGLNQHWPKNVWEYFSTSGIA